MTDEKQLKGGRGCLGLQFLENMVLRGEEGMPARLGVCWLHYIHIGHQSTENVTVL